MFHTEYKNKFGLPSNILPEFLAVKNDLRKIVRCTINSYELKTVEEVCQKFGLFISAKTYDELFKGVSIQVTKTEINKISSQKLFIYITKNFDLIEQVFNIERVRTKDSAIKTGQLFQYPECCINFEVDPTCNPEHEYIFKNNENMNTKSYIYTKYNKDSFSFYLNNFLLFLNNQVSPFYLISHYPCNYNCEKSKVYAKKLLTIIDSEEPLLGKLMRKYLKLPVVFFDDSHLLESEKDENKGFVAEGEINGNSLYKKDLHSLRKYRDFGWRFNFADRITFEKNKIIFFKRIFGNNFLQIGKQKKQTEFDGLLINFVDE